MLLQYAPSADARAKMQHEGFRYALLCTVKVRPPGSPKKRRATANEDDSSSGNDDEDEDGPSPAMVSRTPFHLCPTSNVPAGCLQLGCQARPR